MWPGKKRIDKKSLTMAFSLDAPTDKYDLNITFIYLLNIIILITSIIQGRKQSSKVALLSVVLGRFKPLHLVIFEISAICIVKSSGLFCVSG